MRRSLLTIAFVLMSMSCFGQVFRFQQFCQTGAQNVITQGLNSTTHVQRSYPSCTVAVYLTGTTTLATIYSDALSTPLANPFTANTDGSFGFWAAPAATPSGCYDVTISGGNPGDQLGAPFTFADVCLGIGSGGGGGSVTCPLAVAGAIGAFTSPTGFSCDPNFKTDFNGNFTAISGTFVGPVNGFFTLIGGTVDPGTQAKYKLPTHAFRWLAAASGSSFYGRVPSTHCTPGQVWQVLSNSTDANGDITDNFSCLTPGTGSGSVTSVGLAGPTGITITNSPVTTSGTLTWAMPPGWTTGDLLTGNGSNSVARLAIGNNTYCLISNGTNPTWAVCPGSSPPQALNPSAPTLTTTGAAGTTSYTYAVVGCEDVNCTKHSALSATTTIATGNATLNGTNFNNIKAYADTLYGYRYYKVCRTASSGTPSTTGVIATGAWKSVADQGLAGDGTNCASVYASNTTQLSAGGCIASALPSGVNVMPGAPCGVDAPPTSPNALDDELTYGDGTNLPGGTVYTDYTWLNQGSCTVALTNGELKFDCPSNGTNVVNARCLIKPLGSIGTSYTITAFLDLNTTQATSINDSAGIFLYESGSGKLSDMGIGLNAGSLDVVQNYSAVGTISSTVFGGQPNQSTNGRYIRIQRAGANLNYYSSPGTNGVVYDLLATQAVTSAFTTAPDNLAICMNAFNGPMTVTFDYVRVTVP